MLQPLMLWNEATSLRIYFVSLVAKFTSYQRFFYQECMYIVLVSAIYSLYELTYNDDDKE